MAPDTAIFGEWLRERRESVGLSQRNCARLADIDEGGFRKIEKGQILPSPANLVGLAGVEGLGATFKELLDVLVADKAQRERDKYERAKSLSQRADLAAEPTQISSKTKRNTKYDNDPHIGRVASGNTTVNPKWTEQIDGDFPE
jgi:transcriptional regulator with XRE-family HTH domain